MKLISSHLSITFSLSAHRFICAATAGCTCDCVLSWHLSHVALTHICILVWPLTVQGVNRKRLVSSQKRYLSHAGYPDLTGHCRQGSVKSTEPDACFFQKKSVLLLPILRPHMSVSELPVHISRDTKSSFFRVKEDPQLSVH